MRQYSLLCILPILSIFFPFSSSGKDCNEILSWGLFDRERSNTDTSQYKNVIKWACAQQAETFEQLQKGASSAGINLSYGIFQAAGSSANLSSVNQFRDWKRSTCSSETDIDSFISNTFNEFRKANADIIDAWRNCDEILLQCWVESKNEMGEIFKFRYKFIPVGNITSAKIERFSFSQNAVCEALENFDLSNNDKIVICSRTGEGPIFVAMKSSQNDCAVILPSISNTVEKEKITQVEGCNSNSDIIIPAADFVKKDSKDIESYGSGMIRNAPPYENRPNRAVYEFTEQCAGVYDLFIEYASKDSRSVELRLNGAVIALDSLKDPTGGFEDDFLVWKKILPVHILPGTNILQIDRQGYFPHIRTIRLEHRVN